MTLQGRTSGTDGAGEGRTRAVLITAVLVAAASRAAVLAALFRSGVYPVLPHSDSHAFYSWARDVAAGDLAVGGAFMKWPLYPYLAGLLLALGGGEALAVYLLQMLLGAAMPLLLFLAGRRLFDVNTALVAAVLGAAYPLYAFYDGLFIYTSLAAGGGLLLLLFLLKAAEEPRPGLFLPLGLAAGCVTLLQANFLLFAVPAALGAAARGGGPGGRAARAGLFALGFCAALSPVVAHNVLSGEGVILSGNNGVNFFLGNNPEATGTYHTAGLLTPTQERMFTDARNIAEAEMSRSLTAGEVSRYWRGRALEFASAEPSAFAALMLRKTLLFFSAEEFIHDPEFSLLASEDPLLGLSGAILALIMPLALTGGALSLGRWRRLGVLYLAVAVLPASIILFFVSSRYRVPVMPFLTLFAARGVTTLTGRLRGNRSGLLTCVVLLAAAVALTSGGLYRHVGVGADEKSLVLRSRHLQSANELRRAGMYEEARDHLEEALRLRPGDHLVLFSLAMLNYEKGDRDGALDYLNRTTEIFPFHVDAHYNRAVIRFEKGDFDAARESIERAAALDGTDAEIFFLMGRVAAAQGDVQAAQRHLGRALLLIGRWDAKGRAQVEAALGELGSTTGRNPPSTPPASRKGGGEK